MNQNFKPTKIWNALGAWALIVSYLTGLISKIIKKTQQKICSVVAQKTLPQPEFMQPTNCLVFFCLNSNRETDRECDVGEKGFERSVF